MGICVASLRLMTCFPALTQHMHSVNEKRKDRQSKEGYFHVLVFYELFHKRKENISPRVPIHYRNTRGSLEELELGGNTCLAGRVPTSISRSDKLPLVFL